MSVRMSECEALIDKNFDWPQGRFSDRRTTTNDTLIKCVNTIHQMFGTNNFIVPKEKLNEYSASSKNNNSPCGKSKR